MIGGIHEIRNADWWDAGLTSQLTPFSLRGSLGRLHLIINFDALQDLARENKKGEKQKK